MSETPVSLADIAALSALANGIVPADARDAGAASIHAGASIAERMRRGVNGPIYADGLNDAALIARKEFGRAIDALNAAEIHSLLAALAESSPAFFRVLRGDVCGMYMSDPGVWERIGFPGPSSDTGGYPDFDQPQSHRVTTMNTTQAQSGTGLEARPTSAVKHFSPNPRTCSSVASGAKRSAASGWNRSIRRPAKPSVHFPPATKLTPTKP